MIKLSLTRINEKSPYAIQEVKGGYTFTTAFDILAIIVEKRNPKIQSILEEFDNTVSLLTDKPTQS